MASEEREAWAYIIGAALGDGNLSSPNGRATRLRITCNAGYPNIGIEIRGALTTLLPRNRVSIVDRSKENCFDISVYSNRLNDWMPWQVGKGSKAAQNARVPSWIKGSQNYMRACLKGLIQTDGCIYSDRGYLMVNFTNNTKDLVEDAREMIEALGYICSFSTTHNGGSIKHTVRVARKSQEFIEELRLYKS
jgi:hypothetical protein